MIPRQVWHELCFGHVMKLDSQPSRQQERRTIESDGLMVLTSLAEMADHKHLWCDLDNRSTADLVWFQSYDWCFNWMCLHGGKQQPHVLMLIEHGKAVAVLPLMKSYMHLGMRVLRILGEPHSQYGNVLTETGELTSQQKRLLETALFAAKTFDGLVCNFVPEGSALQKLMGNFSRMARLDNQSLAVDLKPFASAAAYQTSLSKNLSKNLKRRRKHLEELGTLQFSVLRPTEAGYAEAIARCMEMKQQWLIETGRLGLGLQQSGHTAFLKSIPQHFRSGDGPLAFVLTLAGKAIAIELGFLQRGHYYSYMGAFDWSLRQQAPGRLQMHETIGWLIGQGAHCMDLLANPSDYKREMASRSLPLASYALSHNLRGAAYASLWAGWVKPQLKSALAAIPERWRTSFNHVRKLEFSN